MGRITSEDTNRVWRGGVIGLWFQECIHNSQALGARPANDKNEFGHDTLCELLKILAVVNLASSIPVFYVPRVPSMSDSYL